MTESELLKAEKAYLSQLLEAVQRCVYFLDATSRKIHWPLNGEELERRKKDESLFETLSAYNERFSKLQDTLGAAMRHGYLLSGETADTFLKVLSFYEKQNIITSVDNWQALRTARNLAAHDYETDYTLIAEHFVTLHELQGSLFSAARAFVEYCQRELNIFPSTQDFQVNFSDITKHSARKA